MDAGSCDPCDDFHKNKNSLENHVNKVDELSNSYDTNVENGFPSNTDLVKIIKKYETHEPDENYIPSKEEIEEICRRYGDNTM